MFVWGRTDNGAIGLHKPAGTSLPAYQNKPKQLTLNLDHSDKVNQIDCGLEHSCFLTADSHVFMCGEGEYGQLGTGHSTVNQYRPIRIKFYNLVAGDYVT